MKFIFETVAETQKTSLEAAVGFTDTFLIVFERLTQLNIEVTRTAFEKSSEMTKLCLDGCLAEGNAFGWNVGVESGVERFSKYFQAVCEMAQSASCGQPGKVAEI